MGLFKKDGLFDEWEGPVQLYKGSHTFESTEFFIVNIINVKLLDGPTNGLRVW